MVKLKLQDGCDWHVALGDRLRLRVRNGTRDEFHLAAVAHNLLKLAKLIRMPAQAVPACVGQWRSPTAWDNDALV